MSSPGVYRWRGCREPGSSRRMGARCPLRGEEGRESWYLWLPAALDGRRRIRRGGFPSRDSAEAALAQLRMPARGNRNGPLLTVGRGWSAGW